MASVVNINDVLDGHVVLDLECLDRIYLNAYVPNLQVGGQVVTYLTRHLGYEVPSPSLFKRIGDRFRAEVKAFAEAGGIPLLHLKRPDRTRWDDRKLDHVRPHLEAAEREGRTGVVAIVAAQEIQKVFMGYARGKGEHGKAVNFAFDKADRAVTVYYFYVHDAHFGPGFISCAPTSPIPGRCGSTATSGPSARLAGKGSPSPSWPTALRPPTTPGASRGSATGSAPATSRPSSSGGWPTSPSR